MNTIKYIACVIIAFLLSGCIITFHPLNRSLADEPVRSHFVSTCKMYKLPELGDTPSIPSIITATSTPLNIAQQRMAMVDYIEQLHEYVSVTKKIVITSYTRYVVSCID